MTRPSNEFQPRMPERIRKGVSWATRWSSRSPADRSPDLTNRGRSVSFRGVCACQIGRPEVAHEYRCFFVRQDLAFQHHLRCHRYRDRAYIPQQLWEDYLFERSRSRRAGPNRAMRLSQLRYPIDWMTARHPSHFMTQRTANPSSRLLFAKDRQARAVLGNGWLS